MTEDLNRGLVSNIPTHNLLGYGDYSAAIEIFLTKISSSNKNTFNQMVIIATTIANC